MRSRRAAADSQFSYDTGGQLVEVRETNGSQIRFGYDAMGRRAWKEVNGKRTEFIWSFFDLVAEIEDGRVTRRYCSFLMTPLAQWSAQSSVQSSGGQWFSTITNHISAPQELIDEQGAISWQVQLDSYGRVLSERGSGGSPFRFRGQYHDHELNLYYNIHRYYHPVLASYLSPDPIGIQGGVNFYA